jgi:hypothetical protein
VSLHLPSRALSCAGEGVPWADLAGVRIGIVLWGGLVLVDLGRLVAAPSYVELGALAALVTAAATGMRTTTGLAAALVGWLLVDGFVEHRYGVLGFDGPRDTTILALFLGLALVATRRRA